MVELLNLMKMREQTRRFFRLLLVSVVSIALSVLASSTADAKKAPSVETVTPSARTFNFEVNRNGGITGDINHITFQASRVEEVTGVLKRCRKIQFLYAYYVSPRRLADPFRSFNLWEEPSSDFYRIGKNELDPPLCNYTNVSISGQPFRNDDISSVCYEPIISVPGQPKMHVPPGAKEFIPGRTATLNKDIIIKQLISEGSVFTGEPLPIPDKKIPLTANIRCAGKAASDLTTGVPPLNTSRTGFNTGQGASGGGAGTTGGSVQCDLTGTWFGYNNGTRTTGWKFNQIFTSAGSVTYSATHLSTQGTPTNSNDGTLVRSSSGNYLFHTLLTKIPTANGNYQASTLRIYDADAACSKLTERQLYNSTSGMINRPGTYWLQKAGAPPSPVPSPVGRPTGPTNNRFRPRRAPVKPGDTFQPGPNIPKPGPTGSRWNKR